MCITRSELEMMCYRHTWVRPPGPVMMKGLVFMDIWKVGLWDMPGSSSSWGSGMTGKGGKAGGCRPSTSTMDVRFRKFTRQRPV